MFQQNLPFLDQSLTGSVLKYLATCTKSFEGSLENPEAIRPIHNLSDYRLSLIWPKQPNDQMVESQIQGLTNLLEYLAKHFFIRVPYQPTKEPQSLALTLDEQDWIVMSPSMTMKGQLPDDPDFRTRFSAMLESLSALNLAEFASLSTKIDPNHIIFDKFNSVLATFGTTGAKPEDLEQGMILHLCKAATSQSLKQVIEDTFGPGHATVKMEYMPPPKFYRIQHAMGTSTEDQANAMQRLCDSAAPILQDDQVYRLLELNLLVNPDGNASLHHFVHCLLMKKLYQKYGDKAYVTLSFVRRALIHINRHQPRPHSGQDNC